MKGEWCPHDTILRLVGAGTWMRLQARTMHSRTMLGMWMPMTLTLSARMRCALFLAILQVLD